MKTWNVKKFSKLAKVTIRTLHYYDKIGLLKPACRLPNGYRVYTEEDLNKLNKITALKFCGFKLSHIRHLLDCSNNEVVNLFNLQFQHLQEKLSYIKEAQLVLMEQIIKELETTNELNWQNMIQFIHSYTQKKDPQSELAGQLVPAEYLQLKKDLSDEFHNL